MGFESLLGNERLRENLTGSIQRGRIAHFYLISGPEGSGKRTLARLLAGAILCRETDRPCLRCAACRKVAQGLHPDLITVDDPEKKTIPVELVRSAIADMSVFPNEADHKIYMIPRAQDLNPAGQNALLKILEEPPSYGVFLLLTDNPEKLLPTVRSRCTELALQALPEQTLRAALEARFPEAEADALAAAATYSGGYLGQAIAIVRQENESAESGGPFLAAFGSRDTLALLCLLVPMEKWKRDQLIPALQHWLRLLENALACRSGARALSSATRLLATQRSSAELMDAIGHIKKAIEYAQGNVSVGAICCHLSWVLR